MPVGPLQERRILMTLTSDPAIEWLTRSLLDCSLPKSEWTHAAHFAAALWILRHRPELAEPVAFRPIIIAYNETILTANTDTGGYHHTSTVASLKAAANHLARHSRHTPVSAVLEHVLASAQGHSGWLLAYWRRETLFSVAARRDWVKPDLAALPF
jgi:hypothetical protein